MRDGVRACVTFFASETEAEEPNIAMDTRCKIDLHVLFGEMLFCSQLFSLDQLGFF